MTSTALDFAHCYIPLGLGAPQLLLDERRFYSTWLFDHGAQSIGREGHAEIALGASPTEREQTGQRDAQCNDFVKCHRATDSLARRRQRRAPIWWSTSPRP
jgi:hypothetical protein